MARNNRQPDFSDKAEQLDMFGPAKPQVYQPKPEHVRNTLCDIIADLRKAKTKYPWNPSVVRLHRETFSREAALLPDAEEAARLCAEFEAELKRLDAA